jgi:hypothetical protein
MKVATVKISEIAEHPTQRMDAEYWVNKKDIKLDLYEKVQIISILKLKVIHNEEVIINTFNEQLKDIYINDNVRYNRIIEKLENSLI